MVMSVLLPGDMSLLASAAPASKHRNPCHPACMHGGCSTSVSHMHGGSTALMLASVRAACGLRRHCERMRCTQGARVHYDKSAPSRTRREGTDTQGQDTQVRKPAAQPAPGYLGAPVVLRAVAPRPRAHHRAAPALMLFSCLSGVRAARCPSGHTAAAAQGGAQHCVGSQCG